jgi:hypothetical protein
MSGAEYLKRDCHEQFQVIVPALCGKTNKTSRYHDICRNLYIDSGDARWRNWLRHYAKNRQVADSIPDDVIGIFQ